MRAGLLLTSLLMLEGVPGGLRGQTDSAADSLEQLRAGDGAGELELGSEQLGLRSRLRWRLQEPRGYADGTYTGSRLKSYQRLVVAPAPFIRCGLLATKDPGEPSLGEFVSGNLVVQAGRSTLLAGDFRLEAGQGLVFWRGYGFGKGAEVVSPVLRAPRMLVTSLSADEIQFFRGGAARWTSRRLDLLVFASRRLLPATVDTSGALPASVSLFRTESERARRGTLGELVFGGAADLEFSGSRAGVLVAHAGFTPELRQAASRQLIVSVSFDLAMARLRLSGELARAGGPAGVTAGAVFTASPSTRLVIAARSLPQGFGALHGYGFAERPGGSNETGVYAGLDHRPDRRWKVAAYLDRFWFPHPTAANPYGAGGYDALVEIRCREALVRLAVRSDQTSSGATGPPGVPAALSGEETSFRVRLQADHRLSREVALRSRLEKVFVTSSPGDRKEQGLLFCQDIEASAGARISANIRLAFFTTGSFASRLYALERDLEGVLSLPAYSGTGTRWYLLIRWRPRERLAVSLKYSETVRDDVRSIGSGPDRLPSNRDGQLGLQLDCSLP